MQQQQDSKLPPSSSSSSSSSTLLASIIRILHLNYALAILLIVTGLLWSRGLAFDKSIDPPTILSLSIAAPLIIDNLRYTGLFSSSSLATSWASKTCFFAHEVITPFGLMFIPLIFDLALVPGDYHALAYSVFFLISILLAYLGWQRFKALQGWKIETIAHGLTVCRPAHTSHAALIPIFMQVIGLILCSGYLCFFTTNLAHTTYHPTRILFYSQSVVFLGNGAIGPNKLLMQLFGNALEVLWLYSIVHAAMNK